jgi:hypothetical protein
MKWYTLDLPTGEQATLPADIRLKFLAGTGLTPQQLCATAYLPWRERYLEHVPEKYQPFFKHVLPHLGNRSTNVHTALSVSQLPFLINHATEKVDARAVYLGTILHDAGWSLVSHQGIADSLSFSGLKLSETSRLPKQQHVLIGTALAYDLLNSYDFGNKPLSQANKHHISQIIRRHDYDAPWDKGKFPTLTPETKLVCDADRLWSYTHENFWQDTVRKSIRPEDYLVTISGAIDDYFITPQGRVRAHGLVANRRIEVEEYLDLAKTAAAAKNRAQ